MVFLSNLGPSTEKAKLNLFIFANAVPSHVDTVFCLNTALQGSLLPIKQFGEGAKGKEGASRQPQGASMGLAHPAPSATAVLHRTQMDSWSPHPQFPCGSEPKNLWW